MKHKSKIRLKKLDKTGKIIHGTLTGMSLAVFGLGFVVHYDIGWALVPMSIVFLLMVWIDYLVNYKH
jgi:uncharacterized membrane protein (Fun14 family)